jgi:hypothetical protein
VSTPEQKPYDSPKKEDGCDIAPGVALNDSVLDLPPCPVPSHQPQRHRESCRPTATAHPGPALSTHHPGRPERRGASR